MPPTVIDALHLTDCVLRRIPFRVRLLFTFTLGAVSAFSINAFVVLFGDGGGIYTDIYRSMGFSVFPGWLWGVIGFGTLPFFVLVGLYADPNLPEEE